MTGCPFRSDVLTALVVIVVLAVAALVIVLGAPPSLPPGPRALPPPSGIQYGANVNLLFNDLGPGVPKVSQPEIDAQLLRLRRAGATVARSDSIWEVTELHPPVAGVHHYTWAFDDKIVSSLARAGLRWQPLVDYTANWAQSVPGQDHSPPTSDADYADYAAALAARYGPGGVFWREHPGLTPLPTETYEIWNEPDNPGFWWPAPNANTYDRLYVMARDAIKKVDPGARVIVGGLIDPARFLALMLRAMPALRTRLDGVGIHPYAAGPGRVLASVVRTRRAMTALGLGATPLYVTEFGWTTSPPGAPNYVPATRRPTDIARTLAALGHSGCGVSSTTIYTWLTPDTDPGNDQNWYGLSDAAATVTASVRAFAAGVAAGLAPAGQAGGSDPLPAC